MLRYKLKVYSAFTLIELLVVIAIIGILTALAVVSLQNSRRSARDTKRLSDVKQIQIALELYYHDNNNYPETLVPGESLASNSITYMETIPYPPTTIDGDCSTTSYTYSTSNDQSYYNIHFCLSSNTGSLPAGEVVASPRGLGVWTCGERLLDERDNQSYATVQIGNQCWMQENLNYDRDCDSTDWVAYTDTMWCGCYNNSSTLCDTYGKLYQWSAAMDGTTTPQAEAQGVCPDSWHIPTRNEINELTSFLSSPSNSQYQCGGNPAYIAKSLSSSYGWISTTTNCMIGNNQQTNNATGFNVLPAGFKLYNVDAFGNMGAQASYWNSDCYACTYHFLQYMNYVYINTSGTQGFYIRCLKD